MRLGLGLHELAEVLVNFEMQSKISILWTGAFLNCCLFAADPLPSTYRLHFRVTESRPEAKDNTGSNRNFQMIVQSRSRGKINASRRLPHYTSTKSEAKELHLAALGSMLECIPEDRKNGVRLDCSFESSFVAPDQGCKPVATGFLPVIHSRQMSSTAVLPIGTEVLFASFEDPASGNLLEIYLVAQRLVAPGAEMKPAAAIR